MVYSEIFGGTPVYAGPRAYERDNKDFFSFARLVLELYTTEQGIDRNFCTNLDTVFDPVKDFLYMCFYPQEDKRLLKLRRSRLTPFLQTVKQMLAYELESHYHRSKRKTAAKKAIFDRLLRQLETGAILQVSSNSATNSLVHDTLMLEHQQLDLNLG